MKNLVLSAAVLGVASFATGCTVTHTAPASTADVTWDLLDWNDQSKSVIHDAPCPTGSFNATVYSLPSTDTNRDHAVKDVFNCTDKGGFTDPLTPGSYNFWVDITDSSGAVLYAESNSVAGTITATTSTPVDFAFQVNRGFTAAAWALNHTGGAPADCTGVNGIEFVNTNAADPNKFVSDVYTCADGHGQSDPLPLATYNTSAEALDAADKQIGQAPLIQGTKIAVGNEIKNLGTVVITLD